MVGFWLPGRKGVFPSVGHSVIGELMSILSSSIHYFSQLFIHFYLSEHIHWLPAVLATAACPVNTFRCLCVCCMHMRVWVHKPTSAHREAKAAYCCLCLSFSALLSWGMDSHWTRSLASQLGLLGSKFLGSASPCPPIDGVKGMCSPSCIFTWVLGIWTHSHMLAESALLPLRHLPVSQMAFWL